MTQGDYYYEVDSRNRLRSISPSWCRFAIGNGAKELAHPRAVTGRTIWSFIAGEETRHIYGLIFSKVRHSGEPIVAPFRCDSPTRRRFMKLRVELLQDSGLSLTSSIERQEERSYVLLLDDSAPRGEGLLSICAWCKRVDVGGGDWLEVEEAVQQLRLFEGVPMPRLSHHICSSCEEPWRVQLQ